MKKNKKIVSKGTITKLGTPDFKLKSKHTRCKIPTKDPNDTVLENKYVLRKNNNGTGEICSILSTRIISNKDHVHRHNKLNVKSH